MNEGSLLDRRTYLKASGALAAVGSVGVAGCLDDASTVTATGTLTTQVTDQPGDIGDFESCMVTIQGLWAKPASDEDDSDETDGGDEETETPDQSNAREYHEFDEPQEADLVQLQDGETQLVDDRDLAVGDYEYLQLDVTDVDGTLVDGGDPEVSTPGNAPLQFRHAFEIRADQRAVFTADFTPVRRGMTDSYLLKPVAQGTSVEYEDRETDESDDTDD